MHWYWQQNNTQKNKITNPMTSKLTPVKKTHKENTQKETKPNQQA